MNAFEAIRESWCDETRAPGSTGEGPCGQCAVTALVLQDLFGGELLRAEMPGGSHYWNRIPGLGDVDLTREQYPADAVIPAGTVVPRSRLLEGERAIAANTPQRYYSLKIRTHVKLNP